MEMLKEASNYLIEFLNLNHYAKMGVVHNCVGSRVKRQETDSVSDGEGPWWRQHKQLLCVLIEVPN